MAKWNPKWQLEDLKRLINNYAKRESNGESAKQLASLYRKIRYRSTEIRKRKDLANTTAAAEEAGKLFSDFYKRFQKE